MYFAVVDRLKSFLPEMAAANSKLEEQMQQSPEACNIENISESDERVIEMVSEIDTAINVLVNFMEAVDFLLAFFSVITTDTDVAKLTNSFKEASGELGQF